MNLFLLQAPNSVLGTKIVLNKQSDLILHGAEIVAPTGIVEADIDGLVSHFTQIEQTISDSGSQLNSGIDNEASIRLEADQSLAADLAAEKGRIDVILDGSTVDLDQFKEVVDFVQSIDLENDESLLNAIVNINQNIDNVIGDFESADSDILDQLSTLTIYTEDQVNIISSGLEQEIIDRADAVQGVQNDLNNYKDYTDTTIINLQNNISMGDESLATSLSSEVSSRISGDESLATLLTNSLDQNYSQLSSEIAALDDSKLDLAGGVMSGSIDMGGNSITQLQTLNAHGIFLNGFEANTGDRVRVYSDIDFMENAVLGVKTPTNGTDAANKTYVDSADQSLQTQIDFITSNVDPAALDSLTEIVSAFQSADGDINNAITNLADAAGVNLSVEVAARISSDESLASALVDEQMSREKGEKDLNDRLESEIKRAEEAEASLEVDLSTEASIRLSSDESLASALVDEQMSREKGEKDLNVRLESEIKRAEEAEASLEVALSTEVSYLVSNTDLSSIDSFSEVVADLSSEVARAESVEASIAYLTGTALQSEVTRAQSAESSLQARVNVEYFKKVGVNESVDGTRTKFSFDKWSKSDSESIFLNGLLMTAGEDYSVIYAVGNVFGIEFMDAPFATDKVKAYGVYAQDAHDVTYYENLISDLQSQKQQVQADMEQLQSSTAQAQADRQMFLQYKAQAEANGETALAADWQVQANGAYATIVYNQGLNAQYTEQSMTFENQIKDAQNQKQKVQVVIQKFNGGGAIS